MKIIVIFVIINQQNKIMKKEQINPEDFNFFRDENGVITAEPKKKSLKLEDIIREQIGKKVYFANDRGDIVDDICREENTYIDQFSQKSARKVLLFGYIQRIADYSNGDTMVDWNDENQLKYVILYDHKRNTIIIPSYNRSNYGLPLFCTPELASQAYYDNKEIFDEFFSL